MTTEPEHGNPVSGDVPATRQRATSPPTARTIRILEFLAARPQRQFPLAEISQELSLNKATCLSILLELTSAGWLIRNSHTKLFSLGPALHTLGSAANMASPALEYARVAIHDLVENKAATGIVVARQRDELVVLDSAGPESMDPKPRQRTTCGAPFGICYVAWDHEEILNEWFNRAENPPAADERVWLERVLESMRRYHYGIDSLNPPMSQLRLAFARLADDPGSGYLHSEVQDLLHRIGLREQLLPDQLTTRESWAVNVIYAPIFDADSLPILNISLHPLHHQMKTDEIMTWAQDLVDVASSITAKSGGSLPD